MDRRYERLPNTYVVHSMIPWVSWLSAVDLRIDLPQLSLVVRRDLHRPLELRIMGWTAVGLEHDPTEGLWGQERPLLENEVEGGGVSLYETRTDFRCRHFEEATDEDGDVLNVQQLNSRFANLKL